MHATVFPGHTGAVYALCPGPAGTFLSAGGDGLIVRWRPDRPDAGELLANAGAAVFALTLASDARTLYAGDEHGGLHVLDLVQRREVLLAQEHRKGVFSVVPLPDGRVLCTGGDGALTVWRPGDGASLELQRRIPLSEGKLRGAALGPDGQWVAVAGADGHVRVLDVPDLNEHFTLKGAEEGMTCVAWHPRKPVLLAGGKDGRLRTWHSAEGFRPLYDGLVHTGTVYAIACAADGRTCATVGRDKTVKLWDAGALAPIIRLDRTAGGHSHSVNAAVWLGDALVTGGDDRKVVRWESVSPDLKT